MQLAIRHVTRYSFSEPAAFGLNRLRLRPKTTNGQKVLDWSMKLEGARIEVEYDDEHHNHVALASIEPGSASMTITCEGQVATADNAGVIGQHAGFLPLWHFLGQTNLTNPGPMIRALASRVEPLAEGSLDRLHALSGEILAAVRYEIGHTGPATTAEAAMEAGRGVCQDHTHIFVSAARQLGFPARYVSGYLMMDDRIDQEAGHAWAEAYVENLGWVGFDISNGISPDPRYVRVATGRDYTEASPVSGLYYGAGDSRLDVTVAVEQQLSEQ